MIGPSQPFIVHHPAVSKSDCASIQNAAWIVIRAPGTQPRYCEIPADQVAAVVAELEAIGDCPQRFKAFVNARTTGLI